MLEAGELEEIFAKDIARYKAKLEDEARLRSLPKLPRRAPVPVQHLNMPGRQAAETSASVALKSALSCRFSQLRNAAMAVLREAFSRCKTKKSVYNYLGLTEFAFDDLRRTFPLEFRRAANLKAGRVRNPSAFL